ncbi:MAG: protein kinase [Proteobacteria bacterium]|nr:protein kinase [Pseudomonadota bacterium]
MGVVWEGVHRGQGLHVAVKVLTAVGAMDETFRQAFTNEVRAVARLHHPSIIRLLDYGITDDSLYSASEGQIASGSQYYAMELATGGTLPRPKSPLPWLQMRFLLLELLDALAHAHARDVIHRDIKPSNILLMHDSNQSRVMLTDFGIAKAVGTTELPDGMVAGTPRYMAPEQILNQFRDQGPWTDLYSIGCLAYLFATGRRIFNHVKGTEVLRCQLREEPEPVTGRHLPEGFQQWLSKMLAKKISDRFEYAAEAAWELVCLPDPVEDLPQKSEVQDISLESGESNAVTPNGDVNSSFFDTLYHAEQVELRSTGPSEVMDVANNREDIADDLLADMGETMRMASEDIAAMVVLPQAKPGFEPLGEKHDLATLAEVYRQRLKTPKIVYNNHEIVPAPRTWRREAYEERSGLLNGAGLGLWGFRSIPMVGRETERDIIYTQLVATRTDRIPRCIVLDGPRGCGKSRIIEWMSQRAHELSIAHTLKAYHYDDHQNAPGIARAMMYYLSCQNLTRARALERIQWFLSEHTLENEYDDALPMLELMQLQDDPNEPVPGIRFASIEEQYAVLSRFLVRICHDRAAYLWLDDVHNSKYSLDFVEYILNSGIEIPLLILCSCRSEDLELMSPQEESYKRMLACNGVTKLDILPLASDVHLELVHQLTGLDDELCYQVAQRTSGMPLFAIQLVGDWIERGVLVPGEHGFRVKEGASVALPDSLHELWISRIRSIFRDTKKHPYAFEQLELAACLGVQFDADEWRIVCEMADTKSNAGTLEIMLEHQLFELRYPTIRFVHEILRESMIRYMKEIGRSREFHLVCADMLETYFASVQTFYHERRAEHLFAAHAYEACLEPLLQAAIIRRQRGEFDVAHTLFRRREVCLEYCKADANSPIRALGWIAEAETWLQQCNLENAEPLILQSIELGSRTRSAVVQSLGYKEKGILLYQKNNLNEAVDAMMTSLSFFNEIGERRRALYIKDRAETLWFIGRICDVRHELDLARVYFQQAIDIQIQMNDQYGLARTYNSLGNTLQHGGFYEEAHQNLEYALSIFQKMGYRIYIANCFNDIGEIYRLGYQQLDQAENYYRNAMDVYREINPLSGSTTVGNLALLLIAKQRYSEAKVLVLEQIDVLEQASQTIDLNWFYAELLPCCAATFDWPQFDDVVVRLSKSLADSMVVDADILYCTELAANLCDRYSSREQGRLCREIALQQAMKLNDLAALQRLTGNT